MAYNFIYDPNSGLTPWPLIWEIEPTKYNWEGTLGDPINFEVKAIPDPDYPQAWNDYYTGLGGTGGTGGVVTVPDLPPEPVVSEYIVSYASEDAEIDQQYFSIDATDGLILNNVDTRLFFPYANIKYVKNEIIKSATFPDEVINDGYDYVVALVPDSRESIEKNITLDVVSDSTEPLSGAFWFLVYNDWNEARSTLEIMAENSRDYFDQFSQQFGDGIDGDLGQSNSNSTTDKEFNPTVPETQESGQTFTEEYNQSYDDVFRQENPDDINNIIDEESGASSFVNRLKSDTDVSITSTTITEDNPFVVEGFSFDDELRDGDIEDIKEKYNLTDAQVIELLRNVK